MAIVESEELRVLVQPTNDTLILLVAGHAGKCFFRDGKDMRVKLACYEGSRKYIKRQLKNYTLQKYIKCKFTNGFSVVGSHDVASVQREALVRVDGHQHDTCGGNMRGE